MDIHRPAAWWRSWAWYEQALVGLSLALVLALLLVAPGGWLDHAHSIGYAVCHQLPERTFFLGGKPLPLCARCSGQYLMVTFVWVGLLLRRDRRPGRFPRRGISLILVAFFVLWAVDGLNSYLTFFPGMPHLYEPDNRLRAITGGLMGLTLSAFFVPIFNWTLWSRWDDAAVIARGRDLLIWLVTLAAVVAAIDSEARVLLYPAALLSALGVLILLTMVNAMILAILLRRDGAGRTLGDALRLLIPGLAAAAVEIVMLDVARAGITRWLGLPF